VLAGYSQSGSGGHVRVIGGDGLTHGGDIVVQATGIAPIVVGQMQLHPTAAVLQSNWQINAADQLIFSNWTDSALNFYAQSVMTQELNVTRDAISFYSSNSIN